MRTKRSLAPAWRTSLRPLSYRLLLASDRDLAQGGLVFRCGAAGRRSALAVIEQLVPISATEPGSVGSS